jgi:hypothetical protein
MLSWPVVRGVLRRPILWPTAVGAVFAFARRGWWREPPFLPLPDTGVMRWRISTAYGMAERTVEPDDVVAYLQWRRATADVG